MTLGCSGTSGPRCGRTSASCGRSRRGGREVRRRSLRRRARRWSSRALVERYRRDPPPATFRVIASPLVAWIWIGGLDRRARRAHRAVAIARGAAAPGALALRGPLGARALARVGAYVAWTVLALLVVVLLVIVVHRVPLRRAWRARTSEETAPRRARGGQGGQVPRDPRRRARPPDGQALRGRLAQRRPGAARGGDRDAARARPSRADAEPARGSTACGGYLRRRWS